MNWRRKNGQQGAGRDSGQLSARFTWAFREERTGGCLQP